MTRRDAYTLIELLVAMASASVLLVGLASSLYLASQALELDGGVAHRRVRADAALARVLADARTAERFYELTSTAVEFDAPDRDDDGAPERVRYAWSGVAGDPLTRSLNGSAPVTLLRSVDSLDFDWINRAVTAQDVTVTPPPAWPIVRGLSPVAATSGQVSGFTIETPSGATEGDLLVAVIALQKDEALLASAPSWTLIGAFTRPDKVSLAVFWKRVESDEPPSHYWGWTSSAHGVGYVLRVSNQHPTTPVYAFSEQDGDSHSPPAPAAISGVDNALVLRLGAFESNSINPGQPGLAGHTPLAMEQGGGTVSSGAGYRVWKPAGPIPEADFALTNSRPYQTMTVVIAPDPEANL